MVHYPPCVIAAYCRSTAIALPVLHGKNNLFLVVFQAVIVIQGEGNNMNTENIPEVNYPTDNIPDNIPVDKRNPLGYKDGHD